MAAGGHSSERAEIEDFFDPPRPKFLLSLNQAGESAHSRARVGAWGEGAGRLSATGWRRGDRQARGHPARGGDQQPAAGTVPAADVEPARGGGIMAITGLLSEVEHADAQ